MYNTFFAKHIVMTVYTENDKHGTTVIGEIYNEMHEFSIKYQRISSTSTQLKTTESCNDLLDLII